MANAVRIRVEQRYPGEDFRILHTRFKRRVNESGLLTEYKQRQYHESAGEKRRRKKQESIIKRRKEEREKCQD
jgi:ribosomal protein S21